MPKVNRSTATCPCMHMIFSRQMARLSGNKFMAKIRKDFQVGFEDKSDLSSLDSDSSGNMIHSTEITSILTRM